MRVALKQFPWFLGLAACAVIALPALWIGGLPTMQKIGISSLTLAILVGLLANLLPVAVCGKLRPGIDWTRSRLLRPAIILYGLRLTGAEVIEAGMLSLALDAAIIVCTFFLAIWAGTRWLGLDRETSALIGAGSAICGAAAVVATEPVVKGGADRAAIAIASVVLFGSVAMLLYPWLYVWSSAWSPDISVRIFSVYTGATVHEVAQVLAAGQVLGEDAARLAVTTKMLRVAMLAPFLLILSAWYSNSGQRSGTSRRVMVPWFAIGFLIAVAVRTWLPLPPEWWQGIQTVDDMLLVTAMVAVGATTQFNAIKRSGGRPLLLAGLLFAWLIVGGAGLAAAMVTWLPVS